MTTALVKVEGTTYLRKAYTDLYGNRHRAIEVTRKPHKRRTKQSRKKRTPKSKRWYKPKVHSGWKKDMPAKERRRLLLKAHRGDLLAAARSKQALANTTQDSETRMLAQADATYFLEQYKESKEK